MEINMVSTFTLIILLGIGSQWAAWKYSLPSIFIMSLAGLIIGPLTGFINPRAVVDADLFHTFISVAVALILFEGSLSLDFKEIKESRNAILRIVKFGALIAMVLGALSAHFVVGLSVTTSLVIGALLIVTGPTVILPLLKQAKLDSKVASILKWEGILVDPLGALVALFVYEISKIFTESIFHMNELIWFFVSTSIAAFLGIILGLALGKALIKNLIPEHLKAAITICIVLAAFALADTIHKETGLLAVTIMGIVLANMHLPGIEDLKHFNENISVILTSSVFIMLTSSLSMTVLKQICEPRIILFVASMLFIVRPLSIFLSTINTDISKSERILVSWIAPRGIVALTVSGYFSSKLVSDGFYDASIMVVLTFAVVISTVCAHGFTIQPLAKKLGLAHKGKPGLVIVGSNKFSAKLADFLNKTFHIPTLIVDYNETHLSAACNLGVNHHKGEILHEVENYNLDLMIYQTMLINTPIPMYNILVGNEFIPNLGRANVCQVSVLGRNVPDTFNSLKSDHLMRLGDYRATFLELITMLERGYKFKEIKITEQFTEKDYYEQMSVSSLNLLALSPSGTIEFFTALAHPKISEGYHIISIVPEDEHYL